LNLQEVSDVSEKPTIPTNQNCNDFYTKMGWEGTSEVSEKPIISSNLHRWIHFIHLLKVRNIFNCNTVLEPRQKSHSNGHN